MDEQDKQLFEEAMQGVRPLKHDHKVVLKPTSHRSKSRSQQPRRQQINHRHQTTAEQALLGEPDRFPPWQLTEPKQWLQGDDGVFHVKDGVQPRLLKRLKRGTYPMSMQLDLHGYTRQQADAALHDTINVAQQQAARGLKIITGKGQRGGPHALLKSHVCHWMEQDERVLAFCTAAPSDGGRGALYVLLRKK